MATSLPGKIIEKSNKIQLEGLTDRNIINGGQCGFMENKSCQTNFSALR